MYSCMLLESLEDSEYNRMLDPQYIEIIIILFITAF